MSRLKDLRERMAKAFARMQELRAKDEAGKWEAQDQEAWNTVNTEYDDARRGAELEERCAAAETAMAESRAVPGLQAASAAAGARHAPTRSGSSERRSGSRRGRALSRDERQAESRERALIAEAWAAHQFEDADPGDLLSEDHFEVIERHGLERVVARRSLVGRLEARRMKTMQRQLAERRAAMTTATDPTIIDETWEATLEKSMLYFGPMLEVADIRVTPRGGTVHWNTLDDTANEGVEVAEVTGATDQEAAFDEITFDAYKYTSKPILISHELIEDSIHDVPGILSEAMGERLGRILNRRFTTGDGSSKPQGWAVSGGADSIDTAGSGALAADDLISLIHSVDRAYRGSGRTGWQLNDATVAAIRKLKDQNNQYLWVGGLEAGQADRLLGYPIFYNNILSSTISAGEVIAGFGDWSAYKIRMVRGVRMKRLQERYAELDQEAFLGFVRVDGKLINTARVKRLIIAA